MRTLCGLCGHIAVTSLRRRWWDWRGRASTRNRQLLPLAPGVTPRLTGRLVRPPRRATLGGAVSQVRRPSAGATSSMPVACGKAEYHRFCDIGGHPRRVATPRPFWPDIAPRRHAGSGRVTRGWPISISNEIRLDAPCAGRGRRGESRQDRPVQRSRCRDGCASTRRSAPVAPPHFGHACALAQRDDSGAPL